MTTSLPPALHAWRAWLDWFDMDIAAMLGDLLLRLDPLLGRGAVQAQGGAAEPDGIDDLRQRGPYERLLLTEWALADAVPDEFLRRAANNEHLFLAPRLVTRKTDSQIVAIFDAGPAQWGAPRLVHVAMWILLARRAQAVNARFTWGLVQVPGVLHDADSPEMIRCLLKARTHDVADAEHWQAWRNVFASDKNPAGERWLLAARTSSEQGFSHVASCRRGFDDRLHVAVSTKQMRRRVALELPPARQAESLLSGDFFTTAHGAVHRKIQGKLSLRQPPLISTSGQYVAVPLLGENCAVVLKVQPMSQRKQAAPRYSRWSSGSDLLAGVLSEKHFGGVIADAHHLYFWQMHGFRAVPRPQADELAVIPGYGRWPRCMWLKEGGKTHRFIMLDQAGRLVSWTNATATPGRIGVSHVLVGKNVVAMVQADAQRIVYVEYESGQLLVRMMHRDGRISLVTQLPFRSRPNSVMVAGRVSKGEWKGALCVEESREKNDGQRQGVYRLYRGRPQDGFKECELANAAGRKLLGLVPNLKSRDEYLLLALCADRRTLVGVGERGSETIYQSVSDIMSATVSSDGERVALINLDGQLVVLGEGGRRLLMCVSGVGNG